jgi:hypothetical protein
MMMTWLDPMSIDDGAWVKFGVGIMVLEFVLVHSGALMASVSAKSLGNTRWEKAKVFATAFGFYGMFAGAMALAFQSWTLFITYSFVMVSRWLNLLTHPATAKKEAGMRSGISIIYYLLAVFLSIFIAWPRLGITSSIISDVYPERGSGHWESHPEAALAAGIIYFTLLGITELYFAWQAYGAEQQLGSE